MALAPDPRSQPAPRPRLVDAFGRRARTLRISVTDRCNFRCTYCMPTESMTWFPRSGVLHFEEIAHVAALLVGQGVTRLRLTGGEPTLRRDLPVLVSQLAALPGLERLDMTTNGVALPKLAGCLRDAGLHSITVSLDSLRPERFLDLTRRDAHDAVLRGITAARAAGFARLKLNCVTMRGVNDDEFVDFARFAREQALAVRFIEFMPLDGGAGWDRSRVVPGAEARAAIEAEFPLVPRPERPEAPARPFVFADGAPGEVGFINPVTEPFCGRCDRLRMTADGKIKNCLFDRGEVDVLGLVRSGASDASILDAFEASVAAKGPGGLLEILSPEQYAGLRNMSQVGG